MTERGFQGRGGQVLARNDRPPGSKASSLAPTARPPFQNTGTRAHGDTATRAHPHAWHSRVFAVTKPPPSPPSLPQLSRSQPAFAAGGYFMQSISSGIVSWTGRGRGPQIPGDRGRGLQMGGRGGTGQGP